MTLHDPMRRTERLIEESAGDDVVIYDRDTDRVIALDATDARLWRASDGTRSVADLATLAELTEVEALTSLARLEAAGLMAEDGMSRRGMLTKMGLVGAGVGVAGLASIMAPVAAHASSGINPGPTAVLTGASLNSPVLSLNGLSISVSPKGGVAVVPPVIATGTTPNTNFDLTYSFTSPKGVTTKKTIPVLSSDDGSLKVGSTTVPNIDPGSIFNASLQAVGKTTAKPLATLTTSVNKVVGKL